MSEEIVSVGSAGLGGGVAAPKKDARQEMLLALEARLVAAVGPDRDLEQDIWHALGLCQPVHINGELAGCADYHAPHFTASVDAALTLVPQSASSWDCGRIDKDFCASVEFAVDVDGFHNYHAKSTANAPIALCLAAVRAIIALESADDTHTIDDVGGRVSAP